MKKRIGDIQKQAKDNAAKISLGGVGGASLDPEEE